MAIMLGESNGHRWIPHKGPVPRTSCVLFFVSLSWTTLKQTVELPAGDLKCHDAHMKSEGR